MNSSYNDEFAPNPFRSGSQQQPNQQNVLAQQVELQQNQQGFQNPPPPPSSAFQPDPYSGMTGTMDIPESLNRSPGLQQQPISNDPSQWSGAMDQRAAPVESYGAGGTNPASGGAPSSPFSQFGWRSCVSCFNLESYAQYFDVESVDVTERLKASVFKFWLRDQFRTAVVGDSKTEEMKGPDLYGPVWVSLTLVFVLAVTSNIHAYWNHKRMVEKSDSEEDLEEFEADIKLLLHASSVVLVFVFCISSCFWLGTNCMGMPGISWAMWVCCYGYGQVPYMLAALLISALPFELISWCTLGLATAASALLVLRNLSTPLMAQDSANHAKAFPVIIAILCAHTIYFGVLKVFFFP